MRGLTATERAALLVLCAPTDQEVGDEVLPLVVRGCARQVDEDDRYTYFDSTDLGALALRVCPVE